MDRTVSLLAVFALLSVCSPSVLVADVVEWTPASGGNGHFYQAVTVPDGVTWSEARLLAQDMGSGWDLVTITSAEENAFVYDLVDDSPDYWACWGGSCAGPWLGAFQVSSGYSWVTGEPFHFTNWGPYEPFGNGNRVTFFGYHTSMGPQWNDVYDGVTLIRAYIAENSMTPVSISRCSWGGLKSLYR